MESDWIRYFIGGGLISFSLGLFILINNRDIGLGDMLKNIIEHRPSQFWNNQLLFLIGLLLSPLLFSTTFYPIYGNNLTDDPVIFIVSGLFVGAGAQISKGGPIKTAVLGPIINIKNSLVLLSIIAAAGCFTQIFISFFVGV